MLDAAHRAFTAFVDRLSRDARAVALLDSDADDQASSGSLPIERWNELLAKLGFGREVFAVR